MARPDVEARLAEIAAANEGNLTPRDVVADARNPDSPLHSEFEWDDSRAAEKYREVQARRLIRSVTVEKTTIRREQIIPVYVRDPMLPKSEQGYRATVSFVDDTTRARALVREELDRALRCLHRARVVADAVGLAAEFDAMIGHAEKVKEAA